MGSKTDEYLASLLNDSYKCEVDSDEAVWRSLPFFGAMLGLTVALLPQIYRSAAGTIGLAWKIPIYTLLALSILLFAIAAGWFWVVIRPRKYRYPPTDVAILEYAEALRAFHRAEGNREEQDERVRDQLRAFILDEFAQTTTNNRRNNNAKLRARSQVLLFAMAGFLVALVCEATILAHRRRFLLRVDGMMEAGMAESNQTVHRREKKAPAPKPVSRPVPPEPQWVWEGASFLPLPKQKGARK